MTHVRGTLACIAFLAAATPAFAQSGDEAEAFRLFKESKALLEAGRADEAVQMLDRAFLLFPMPQILLRQAEANEKAGNLEKALELYRRVDDPKLKAKARKAADDVQALLNQPVDVTIRTNPPGADLTLDHVEQHRTPATLRLTRGAHHVAVRKPGFRAVAEDRKVAGAASQEWVFDLKPVVGHVVIGTDLDSFEGVVIRLDDREMAPRAGGVTASRTDPLPLPAGPHRLLCVREGVAPYTTEFEVPADGTVDVSCRLKPPDRKVNPWKWTGVALGSAAALAGAGLSGWYFYQKGPGGKISSGTDYQEGWIGVGLMAAGIATALTTGLLLPDYLEASTEGSVAPLSVGVMPLPGGGQAAVSLRF